MESPVTRDTVCAGFPDRLGAAVFDAVILLVPNLIIVLVIPGILASLVFVLLVAGYAIYFWSSSGQTPGKRVIKLKG